MKLCPHCEEKPEKTFVTVLSFRLHFIQCPSCMMSGPRSTSAEEAEKYWDNLPRKEKSQFPNPSLDPYLKEFERNK